MNDYPHPMSPAVTASMKGNRRTDTKPEVRLRSALHRLGYRFRKDYPVKVSEKRACRPDIAFTKRKLAIFIDGCFWHLCPDHGRIPANNKEYWEPKLTRNKRRDDDDTRSLSGIGWKVVRIWEHIPLPEALSIVRREHAGV